MNTTSAPLRLVRSLAICLALILTASAQLDQAAPLPTIEVLAFGRELGELRVVQGREQQTVRVGLLPPGASLPLRGGSVEFQRRQTSPEGAETWVPVASTTIEPRNQSVTTLLVPNRQAAEGELPFLVKLFPRPDTLPRGVYELANLTPSTLLVQTSAEIPPVEIPAWGRQVFTPETDRKFRTLMRIAYRTNPGAQWTLIQAGIVNLPPDQSIRAQFVFAAAGLGEFGDPEDLVSRNNPLLIVMDRWVPVARIP